MSGVFVVLHSLLTIFCAYAAVTFMMLSKARPYIGWTESELHAEIRRIGERIQKTKALRDERSRCATSFLCQLLHDREDTLATLVARGGYPRAR